MGRKKATSLKKDTKQLLDAHIDAATTPAPSLFTIDTKPAPARATNNKQQRAAAAKRKRDADAEAEADDDDDAMDTEEAGAAAAAAAVASNPLLDSDSDDEPGGIKSYTRKQLRAHRTAPVLVSAREAKRMKRAADLKAEAEAAARAKPAVFDVWATSKDEDMEAGLRAPTNDKGFQIGRSQQRAFRHRGEARALEHVVPSVLPDKIHEGASFHPDREKHQELLRTAYEKDQSERAEAAAIYARFNVKSASDAAGVPADDSWMDEPANDGTEHKNPASSSAKYSKTKRNQMARAAANKAKHQAAVDEKQLEKFVKRLPVLVAELKKEEKMAAKERARVEQAKLENPDRKPKLGRYAEEEAFPDVALTEELPENGALRKIKPSLSVVKDQFARFQERHLIETRKKVKAHKGLKPKLYERYKDTDQKGNTTAPRS